MKCKCKLWTDLEFVLPGIVFSLGNNSDLITHYPYRTLLLGSNHACMGYAHVAFSDGQFLFMHETMKDMNLPNDKISEIFAKLQMKTR